MSLLQTTTTKRTAQLTQLQLPLRIHTHTHNSVQPTKQPCLARHCASESETEKGMERHALLRTKTKVHKRMAKK